MHIRAPAIVCAARPHGEVGVIVRVLTESHGLVAGYVAGGRGREMRPILIPGNGVEIDLRARLASQLPAAKLELSHSRASFLSEPLPAAAIQWATALTASTLPERHAYPALYQALDALLDAVCHAPSARGWLRGMVGFEVLLLRELGYGDALENLHLLDSEADWPEALAQFDRIGTAIARYLLADRRGDVMGARDFLRQRLARITGGAA
jgi:DNA repair protein RecO (recombination protein O)